MNIPNGYSQIKNENTLIKAGDMYYNAWKDGFVSFETNSLGNTVAWVHRYVSNVVVRKIAPKFKTEKPYPFGY
jgi:ferric-dicitrate binding protein FerR (iron transport regulator)